MKQMILTGLATEQSFSSNGSATFFLVFNGGEFRVPVTQEAAEAVVEEMYSDGSAPVEDYEESTEGSVDDWGNPTPSVEAPDDGVSQI